jgi:uncharacterized hydrophobic protein (TIGR00271 family)
VFQNLRRLGLDRDGLISVERVDAVLDRGPAPDKPAGYLAPEIAPVWEMVEATIRSGAAYAPSFFVLLTIAGLIGAAGILTNSQILIVGAMVVGPEYNAIIAVALGLTKRDRRAVRSGLLALLGGFGAAVLMTLAFGLVIRALGATPTKYLVGVRPVADLINTPNLFSVVVAVLAGLVGVVSLTESRANALIGVFISVTTIPAAGNAALALVFGHFHVAAESALQLLINLTGIVAAAYLVLLLRGHSRVTGDLPPVGKPAWW